MAWVRFRSGSFQVNFRFQGKERNFTLGPVSQAEADAKAAHVDYLLMRLKQGLVELPSGVDIVSFVEQDGKAVPAAKAANRRASETLGTLRDRYLATHEGAQEEKTLYTTRIHFKHVVATLGEGSPLSDLTHASLQQHISRRASGKLSPATIKKEIATLRAAWNWGRRNEMVEAEWPGRGLVYRKTSEKPPFQSREEIERQLKSSGLTAAQKKELWDALYLQRGEVDELLEIVRAAAAHPWIYPMVCTAAHTGARRSELIRMRVADVDFVGEVITVREKKRVRGQLTTRRVPLTKALAGVLAEYLKGHPGGQFLFCHFGEVERSKKRSRTTGHQDQKVRPSGLKGRLSTVRERETPPLSQLTPKETHDHLKRSLADSTWSVVKGWHSFRHAFIGICASSGIDQRFIDEWVGHQTEEQRRRYRHLAPSVQRAALDSAFG